MIEVHPYGEFIPKKPRWMIVGSFPIAKFSNPKKRSEIKPHELDFFFGGEKNLLWKLLGLCFDRDLKSKKDVIRLLEDQGIAVGDVIKACRRKNGGGSDSDLYQIKWNNDLIDIIRDNGIKKVFFTSRKVEVWFNKLFPESSDIEKVTLISPSGQSVRSLSHHPDYEDWEKLHRGEPKFNFILTNYRLKFRTRG
ncbi:uracil-DNA glycosylase family protein [Peredibacter starrii]|uniref:DNA glycosylase n=1 Tax=Peredibacter starrii TaxID=28202 RepID=A0AAX4HUD2_9BACT|nr:hypothetical protein [Peredibacter starrii]WPU67003.1 hypothetical protein SOO65_09590 [Peredibacter starrii]